MNLSNKTIQHITNKNNNSTKLSIYIPTHPASTGPTLSEDTIRFKNAIQIIKAHEKFDERELGETINKLEALLEDTTFWKHRTVGLAVFADTDSFETVDLNNEITEMQYFQDSYVISPLAIMLSIGTGYYVLDINHTKPRLIYFASNMKKEIDLEDMPGSLEQTIDRDEHIQRLQHQGSLKNMFHGQKDSAADDADMIRYYKLIVNAVEQFLIDHDEPLLLTGTENRIGNIRPLFSYPRVLAEAVEGNHEGLNTQELENTTIAVIEKAETADRKKLVAMAKSTPPSNMAVGAKDIEIATSKGKVETLFLSSFKRTTDSVGTGYQADIVMQLPEDVSTTETLVRSTLSQGGNVVAVEKGSFENDEPRALCRY